MYMYNVLNDALDDLASFRSSTARQGRALDALERLLVDICVPTDGHALQSFISLQDTFQCNVPSRLLPWISDRSSHLDSLSQKEQHAPEVATLSSQLIQALSIIQGVVLNHAPSKQYLGRRFALEILIDLFLVSRHITTPTNDDPPKRKGPPPTSLASAVLDTLLCIMVDSSPALRAFEDANGVRAVVRILKRAGTPRETRMKCLEFLYFYLLDETNPTLDMKPAYTEVPTAPNSPTSPTHSRAALSVSQLSDSSVSSDTSTSSAFSFSSASTASTAPSSAQPSPVSKPPPPPLAPAIRPGHRKTASTASARDASGPRALLMLRRDVDFVPQTPAGKSLATPRAAQRGEGAAVSPLDAIGERPGEWKTPRRGPPRMHAPGLADTPAAADPGAQRARGHRRAHTLDAPMASAGNVNVVAPARRVGVRTMEEKKAILGGMMGNVDTLVEGVRKAGIWGLG